MDPTPPNPQFRKLAAITAPLALFFVLLEMVKAARGASWSGFGATVAPGMVLGGLIYWAVIFITGCLVVLGYRRLSRGRTVRDSVAHASAILGAAVLWCALSLYREQTPTRDDALVLAVLFAAGAGYALLFAVRRVGLPSYSLLLTGTMSCGIVTLLMTGQVFLFAPDRSVLLTLYPGVALATAAVIGFAFWLPRGRAGVTLRYLHLPLAMGIPLLIGLIALAPASNSKASDTPNVVVVVSDTLRADYLSLHGGTVPTPELDALAAGGAVFENAYSLAPWTMPSMQGMWTSQYPAGFSPNGTVEEWVDQSWRYCRDTGIGTLAEKLRDRGFQTGALVSNALVWGMPDLMRGYDTRMMAHPIMLSSDGLFSGMPLLTDLLRAWWPAVVDERPHNTTRALDRYARAWLKRYRHEPFHLYIHYIDPHAPYDPPVRYRTLAGAWPFFYPYPGGERWGIPVLGPDHYVPKSDRPYVTDLYKGEVRYIDEFIGRLMGYLKEAGVADNTVVVFTSDHGEELWDHGNFAHGQNVHAESMHVPLILRGPGIHVGRIESRISAIDLLPTLAGLLELETEDAWEGRDISAALRGEDPPPPSPPIFAQATNNKCWPWPQQMVIDGNWKLIRENGSDGRMLYNLTDDPAELHNLAEAHPERVAALEAQLDAWLSTFDSTFVSAGDTTNGLTREAVEGLRGMGYL